MKASNVIASTILGAIGAINLIVVTISMVQGTVDINTVLQAVVGYGLLNMAFTIIKS